MPWAGVTARFSRFDDDLKPTPSQVEDAAAKQFNVRKCLEATYYGTDNDDPPGFVVGSWGKGTPVRPSGDIDLLFPIPSGEWNRINSYSGNSQSILLQEVKGILSERYSSTDLRGDGQVVQVKFNSIMVEVVPAFSVGDGYEFAMPDTHDGGRWKSIWPVFERVTIEMANRGAAGNVVPTARMIKHWKRHCNVKLKSYLIELLAAEFFETYEYRDQSFFYYDWFIRDFFRFLVKRANGSIYSPGSGECEELGSAWLPAAQQALKSSEDACGYEYDDQITLAGLEWYDIFGVRIPLSL